MKRILLAIALTSCAALHAFAEDKEPRTLCEIMSDLGGLQKQEAGFIRNGELDKALPLAKEIAALLEESGVVAPANQLDKDKKVKDKKVFEAYQKGIQATLDAQAALVAALEAKDATKAAEALKAVTATIREGHTNYRPENACE